MAPDWPDIAGRLEGRVHVLPVRIYYEDTDFSGRVYHASYLRFCERGRSDLLRLAGLQHRGLAGAPTDATNSQGAKGQGAKGSVPDVFFAVHRMEIDFRAPAHIDDLIEVRSAFLGLSGARLRIGQSIERDGATLVDAMVTVAILGADGRPRRISGDLKAALAPFLVATDCPQSPLRVTQR